MNRPVGKTSLNALIAAACLAAPPLGQLQFRRSPAKRKLISSRLIPSANRNQATIWAWRNGLGIHKTIDSYASKN
jgi:hypothetical protein